VRKLLAIARATALEILSEPLSLLVLLSALTMTVLAPAFHYHQFGEATRMARDAGFSSLFVCGGLVAVFGTIRAFRREIESGTLEMALAHPVSRTAFFFGKTLGGFVAAFVFSAIVFLTSFVIVTGAAIGGEVARRTGELARLWGPCLAAGVGVMILPLLFAAVLNRFAHFRFVLTVFVSAAVLASLAAGAAAFLPIAAFFRLLAAAVPLAFPTAILLLASAAFAVRFRANAAAAAVGCVFAALLPAVGNYYLSDALSAGGSVPWSYVAISALASAPALVLFALLGVRFINGRDLT